MKRLKRWKLFSALGFVSILVVYGIVSSLLANGVTKAERFQSDAHPGQYNLPFQDIEFTPRGDVLKLKGWHINDPGRAQTLIFVHGLGSDRAGHHALEIAAELWQRGFNLVLFDLRGHGLSDEGRTSGGYFEKKDLLGAFDFVRNSGIASEAIGVLGFSMGAAIAILGASDEPGIQAVVADGTYANIADLITQEVSRTTPLPGWVIPFFQPGATMVARFGYKIKLDEMVPEQAVTELNYPILLIHSVMDKRIPIGHAIRVHDAAYPGSDLWQVPETQHADAFQRYPTEYIQKVSSYFDAQL